MLPRLQLNRTRAAIVGWAGVLALTLLLTACSTPSTSKSNTSASRQATPQMSAHARARAREQEIENSAQQLDTIPPPSKPRYMAIRASTHWQNPFLTIEENTIELRIPAPPEPPVRRSRRGRRRARRTAPLWKTTTVTLDALPAALAALPEGNWPYGRVIAYEDDLSGPPGTHVQVRRNEEKVLNLLNELGVIVYQWPQNSKR